MGDHRILDYRRLGPSAADLLTTARERSQRTQAEIAMYSQTSASALSRYERGKMIPTYDVLRDLLQTCGFALDPALVPLREARPGADWFDTYLRRRREGFGLPLVMPRGYAAKRGR